MVASGSLPQELRYPILVRTNEWWEVSQVLENLSLPPIPGIPWNLRTTDDILGAVDVILERIKEAYDSGHIPWD
jgi:hypothetical protein